MTLYVPLWIKFGVQSKDAEPSPLSVNMAPLGRLEVVRMGMVASTSVALIAKLRFTPSKTVLLPIVARTGAWLPPSVTVMVTTSESFEAPSEAKKMTL